jgi:hypothetical protein
MDEDIVTILDNLIMLCDNTQNQQLICDNNYYPPRVVIQNVNNYHIRQNLETLREYILNPDRKRRVEKLTIEFQSEKIDELEQRISILEQFITQNLNG